MDLSFIAVVLAIYHSVLFTLAVTVWIYATLRSVGTERPNANQASPNAR